MSKAKQMSMNGGTINNSRRDSRKEKKRFMDYAIWVDFPVNAAILAFVLVRAMQMVQSGININELLEEGLLLTGNELLDAMISACLPIMILCIAMAAVSELIYLILRLRGKEPSITEKYSIIMLIVKVLGAVFFAAAALLF